MVSTSARIWWILYATVCGAILLSVFLLGWNDTEALRPLLVSGGLIESLPVPILLTAVLLGIGLMLRSRRLVPWGLFALLCLFLAGEEAEWGGESILGWQTGWIQERRAAPSDLHNLLENYLEQRVSDETRSVLAPALGDAAGVIVLALALGVLTLAVLLGLAFPPYRDPNEDPGRGLLSLWRRNLSLQFTVTGLALVAFGLSDMLLESFGMPYVKGLWPVEESLELLGSLALLFAVAAPLTAGGAPDNAGPSIRAHR